MKVGCDIVLVSRFENVSDSFLNKYFSKSEIEYIESKPNKAQTVAGLFSAKESVLKALGIGAGNGVSLKDIEIYHDALGAPQVRIASENYIDAELRITISHTDANALSACIFLG